jgi:hypothetical protein
MPDTIRREAAVYTNIPPGDLTKTEALDLFRKYASAEVRKNITIKRAAALYDACVITLK